MNKNVENALKICLMVTSCFYLIGCNDKFPASYLYNVDQEKKVCDRYVIDQTNVKFKFDKSLFFEECPVVYGFTDKDTYKVLEWVRRNKTKIEECSK